MEEVVIGESVSVMRVPSKKKLGISHVGVRAIPFCSRT